MPTTEIIVVSGDRFEVEGDPRAVEETIIGAARGSIMALAWFTESVGAEPLAVNPEHVVALRAATTE
jgi:hypothetical protein